MFSIKKPEIRDYVVVHGKRICVGDFIEVYTGIWQGVFKVESIQRNRWLPVAFMSETGHQCWPMSANFRKFDQHEVATQEV